MKKGTVSVEDAAELAEQDPFQFQSWALGLVGARIATSAKKGTDRGIDGRLYVHDDKSGNCKQIILSMSGPSTSTSPRCATFAECSTERRPMSECLDLDGTAKQADVEGSRRSRVV